MDKFLVAVGVAGVATGAAAVTGMVALLGVSVSMKATLDKWEKRHPEFTDPCVYMTLNNGIEILGVASKSDLPKEGFPTVILEMCSP